MDLEPEQAGQQDDRGDDRGIATAGPTRRPPDATDRLAKDMESPVIRLMCEEVTKAIGEFEKTGPRDVERIRCSLNPAKAISHAINLELAEESGMTRGCGEMHAPPGPRETPAGPADRRMRRSRTPSTRCGTLAPNPVPQREQPGHWRIG